LVLIVAPIVCSCKGELLHNQTHLTALQVRSDRVDVAHHIYSAE
jgi:hypothetical protein